MTFDPIPLIFSTVYNFEVQTKGTVFSAISIAANLFTVICIYQEKFAKARNKLPNSPEARLYFSCVESTLIPIGMFLYGWSSGLYPQLQSRSPPWEFSASTLPSSIILLMFIIATHLQHSPRRASAEIVFGGAFQLVTDDLFANLGYGPAGTLLGGIGLLLTFVPWVLMFLGPKIRARSKFANELTR